jgi:hypothetical protein
MPMRNEMAWERIERLHRAVHKHPMQRGIYIFLILECNKVWPSLWAVETDSEARQSIFAFRLDHLVRVSYTAR